MIDTRGNALHEWADDDTPCRCSTNQEALMHLCRIPSLTLVVVLVVALAAPRAHADQILKIHNDSLTSYKPTAKSNIQDVRALVDQRGVHVDGTLRARSSHGMAMAGNPFGEPWDGNGMLSSTRLDTGTF